MENSPWTDCIVIARLREGCTGQTWMFYLLANRAKNLVMGGLRKVAFIATVRLRSVLCAPMTSSSFFFFFLMSPRGRRRCGPVISSGQGATTMLVTYSNLGKGCMFVCVSAKQAHYQTDPWFLLQILWGGRMRLEGKAVA